MAQISTRPQPIKTLIPATLPTNMSADEKKRLLKEMNDAGEQRRLAVEKETAVPKEATVILNFQLRKFGRYWMGYYKDGNKWVPVLPAPSFLPSILGAMDTAIGVMAIRA